MSFLFSFFDQLLISFHSHNQEPPVINYCHLINVFVFYIFPTETPLEIPVPQNPVESFVIPTIPITSKSIQIISISAEYSHILRRNTNYLNLQYHCKVLTQKLKRTNCLAKLKDLEDEKRKNSKNMNLINNIVQNADEKAIFLMDLINNYSKRVPRWSKISVRTCTEWRLCSAKGYGF
jgi:hypothetical protein